MRSRPARSAVLALAVLLVAAGCGSDDGDAGSSSTTLLAPEVVDLAVQSRQAVDDLGNCVDAVLPSVFTPERLEAVGYRTWADFRSPAVQDWLTTRFPPEGDALVFVDVIFACSGADEWTPVVLESLSLIDVPETRCLAEALVADPDLRLLFVFGNAGPDVESVRDDLPVSWVARWDRYHADCGVV